MNYKFHFNGFNILIFIVLFSVFSFLTVWQVIRINDKQVILEKISFARTNEPVSLNALEKSQLLNYEFYPIKALGVFQIKDCFFLENIKFKNSNGKYFYCPFKLANSNDSVVVNMGWVKNAVDRLVLPVIRVSDDLISINTVLRKVRSKPVVMTSDIPNLELENLWLYYDLGFLEQKTGQSYLPITLQLTSDFNDGLERAWPEFKDKIGMHIGYVLHWAAFSLASLILFIKFNFKKIKND